jgi:hypothetical protein
VRQRKTQKAMYRRMVEWLMNDELEKIWLEVIVTKSRHYLLEGHTKTTKNLSQNSRCRCRDSNRTPP